MRSACDRGRRPGGSDAGSAVAEFSLVASVLVLVVVAVAQIGLALHVRATAVACAAEGARYAANADRVPSDAVGHTRQLLDASLRPGWADAVTARSIRRGGTTLVEVRVRGRLPVVGWLGATRPVTVTGHAVVG